MGNTSDLQGQKLADIADYHNDAVDSLRFFLRTLFDQGDVRFIGYTPAEFDGVILYRLEETDLRSCLEVLAAIEAALRIDYLIRSRAKKKDSLSRDFRSLYQSQKERASLSDDILRLWVDHFPSLKALVGELRAALSFRHWLAHGRYWQPKLGRKYDYAYVYLLADLVLTNFPLITS